MISLIFEIQGSPFCGLETQKTSAGDQIRPNAMLIFHFAKSFEKMKPIWRRTIEGPRSEQRGSHWPRSQIVQQAGESTFQTITIKIELKRFLTESSRWINFLNHHDIIWIEKVVNRVEQVNYLLRLSLYRLKRKCCQQNWAGETILISIKWKSFQKGWFYMTYMTHTI